KGAVNEDEVLLHLAIAFEFLLNLEYTPQITARFRESITVLLGPIPRLDSWVEQFYKARSSVVHKGKAQESKFIAQDWQQTRFKSGYNTQPPLRYGSLISHGRIIFRLCLTSILSGTQLVEDQGILSLFVHDEERM